MKKAVPTFKKFSTPTKETMNEEQMFYMFSKNLVTIQKRVEEMLAMDKAVVDKILQDGHDWASDHIATSKDDIEEVANFLMARMKGVDESVDSLNESQIKVGTFVRYKKDEDFTGGKVISIKSGKAEIHNWDGSTIELPVSDLEYVKSWNESVDSLNESGTIKTGNAISSDLTNFLTTVVVPKSKGYVHNERDAAALLLDIIKHRYNF